MRRAHSGNRFVRSGVGGDALGERPVISGLGPERAPGLPEAIIFFLAMVCYGFNIKKNIYFFTRARTRNLQARPPQGWDRRAQSGIIH